jgi:hypothetical protein
LDGSRRYLESLEELSKNARLMTPIGTLADLRNEIIDGQIDLVAWERNDEVNTRR